MMNFGIYLIVAGAVMLLAIVPVAGVKSNQKRLGTITGEEYARHIRGLTGVFVAAGLFMFVGLIVWVTLILS